MEWKIHHVAVIALSLIHISFALGLHALAFQPGDDLRQADPVLGVRLPGEDLLQQDQL